MRIFRSEEHVDAWIARGNPRGESMSVELQWALAQRWFKGRHLPSWRKWTAEEAQALFSSLGLVSDFWSIA
jgi:hypothetical protein